LLFGDLQGWRLWQRSAERVVAGHLELRELPLTLPDDVAFTSSPRVSSGTATAADSSTTGMPFSTDSTSRAAMFSLLRRIMSFCRPTM
jgi:hypothetical protein